MKNIIGAICICVFLFVGACTKKTDQIDAPQNVSQSVDAGSDSLICE